MQRFLFWLYLSFFAAGCNLGFESVPLEPSDAPNELEQDVALEDSDTPDVSDHDEHQTELELDTPSDHPADTELQEDQSYIPILPQFFDLFAEQYCEQMQQCLLPSLTATLLRAYLDHPDCAGMFLASLEPLFSRLTQAELAGRVWVDIAAGYACTQGYLQLCKPFGQDYLLSMCRRAIRGRVPLGERCWSDWECEPGSYCSEPCPGVCTPMSRRGEGCSQHRQCDPGESSLARCLEGTCSSYELEPSTPNSACGELPDSATFAFCPSGFVCSAAPSTPPQCLAPLASGQSCRSSDACPLGQLCQSNPAAGLLCQSAIFLEESAPCGTTGQNCNPLSNLYCLDGVCEARGNGEQNAACLGLSPVACNDGLFCEGTQLQCTPEHLLGEPCSSHAQCASGFCNGVVCVEQWCW